MYLTQVSHLYLNKARQRLMAQERAEEDEGSTSHAEATVGGDAPGSGLLHRGALKERGEHRPVGAPGDLGGPVHEGLLVGVLDHANVAHHPLTVVNEPALAIDRDNRDLGACNVA